VTISASPVTGLGGLGPGRAQSPKWGRGWSRLGLKSAIYGLLLLALGIAIGPLYYIVRTSFQSDQGYLSGRLDFTTSSWSQVFRSTPVLPEFGHSLIVSFASVALILVVSTLAGYSFAKLRPRRSAIPFTAIVAAFMIPIQSIVVPLYLDSAHLHLVGSYLGAIVVYAAVGMPFSVFLMTSFFRGVPDELIEAGLLDGLGYVGVLWRILARLAVPGLVTAGILQFIAVWNDLLVALLWLPSPGQRTITVGLATISSTVNGRVTPIPEVMAAAVVQAIPAVLLFLFLQRYLIRGLTLGINR
jgi:ABC-type glycerol-3-phosphate transport system permease component